MTLRKFDLEKALAGEAVVTREGKKVLELHLFKSNVTHPLVAIIENKNIQCAYKINGKYDPDSDRSEDLLMAPVTEKYWFNVYKDRQNRIEFNHSYAYDNEKEARENIYSEEMYIRTICVELEE